MYTRNLTITLFNQWYIPFLVNYTKIRCLNSRSPFSQHVVGVFHLVLMMLTYYNKFIIRTKILRFRFQVCIRKYSTHCYSLVFFIKLKNLNNLLFLVFWRSWKYPWWKSSSSGMDHIWDPCARFQKHFIQWYWHHFCVWNLQESDSGSSRYFIIYLY